MMNRPSHAICLRCGHIVLLRDPGYQGRCNHYAENRCQLASVEILFGQITTFCGARSNPYLAHSVLADARDFLAIEAIPAVRAKYLFPTHALMSCGSMTRPHFGQVTLREARTFFRSIFFSGGHCQILSPWNSISGPIAGGKR